MKKESRDRRVELRKLNSTKYRLHSIGREDGNITHAINCSTIYNKYAVFPEPLTEEERKLLNEYLINKGII